jgi:hypothetical protein
MILNTNNIVFNYRCQNSNNTDSHDGMKSVIVFTILMLRAPPHNQKYSGNADADHTDEDKHQGDDFTRTGGIALSGNGEKCLSAVDIHIIGARFIHINIKLYGHGAVGCRYTGPGLNDLPVYLKSGCIFRRHGAGIGNIAENGYLLTHACQCRLYLDRFNYYISRYIEYRLRR